MDTKKKILFVLFFLNIVYKCAQTSFVHTTADATWGVEPLVELFCFHPACQEPAFVCLLDPFLNLDEFLNILV